MPFSVTYPKKVETAKGRFKRLTKPYDFTVEKKIWRTERKFCNEIIDTVKNFGVSYKLDRITKDDDNTFLVAIMQQLKREDVYNFLDDETNKYVLYSYSAKHKLFLNGFFSHYHL